MHSVFLLIRFPYRAACLTGMLLCSLFSVPGFAASTTAILDGKIQPTLAELYQTLPKAQEMVKNAAGVLVFPEIAKVGFWVGGEYGEGALLIDGTTVDYYSAAGGSIGLQFGVQVRSQVILFMDRASLDKFRSGEGWEAGVDGSVALVTEGGGAKVDTKSINQPVVAFVFANKGLMAGVSLEGTKFTRLDKTGQRSGHPQNGNQSEWDTY